MRTERLLLRQWKEADREPFAALNCDADVMRYFPRLITPEQSNGFIDAQTDHIATHGWGAWAVERIDSAEFIGFVGFSHPASWHPCAGEIDIGWRLDKRHWGQGYATEAASFALKTGFNSLGFKELVSFTSECNLPSIAVMIKIGMREDLQGFEHPRIDVSSQLRRHVIYRLARAAL
ncbi:GNAT family N-acetyltransferase [Granulosicoccus antarcticus]|uniref:N-acetyltransferase domain-containing protein n=1 Tax=Granulosicoccus antarcticus IMCC3135 TaxID=1192854 RepID=A0A2Z2NUG1_9GAMM|nr:GNAT family N-acetyltransferase [Granulosicoccus antarcticus]ASJ74135.1 hypothetical protein IMCC3135_20285 [Granulosicoccus antarcticus IMCC3135]